VPGILIGGAGTLSSAGALLQLGADEPETAWPTAAMASGLGGMVSGVFYMFAGDSGTSAEEEAFVPMGATNLVCGAASLAAGIVALVVDTGPARIVPAASLDGDGASVGILGWF
jgi:hypothetical protein